MQFYIRMRAFTRSEMRVLLLQHVARWTTMTIAIAIMEFTIYLPQEFL